MCDIVGLPPRFNEFERKAREYSTKIAGAFGILMVKLGNIGDKIPLSLQLDRKQDARQAEVFEEAGKAYRKLIRILQQNVRPSDKLGFDGSKPLTEECFRDREGIPKGMYTIIDFLHGMITANGTAQKWCSILGAFDYSVDYKAARGSQLSYGDKLLLRFLYKRTQKDSKVSVHASLCVLCARQACSVCHGEIPKYTPKVVSNCMMNLILLLSGSLEWRDPLAYELRCWEKRGASKAHLSYAPTSLDIFCPKQSWSEEATKRFGSYVRHKKCSKFVHDTVLHTVYEEGETVDWVINNAMMKAVQENKALYQFIVYNTAESRWELNDDVVKGNP